MTKKELERRNDFLLLQLKIVNQLVSPAIDTTSSEIYYVIGKLRSLSNINNLRECIKFIEELDREYNCFDKDITINDYKLDGQKGECL